MVIRKILEISLSQLVFGGFKAFVTNVLQWRGAHSTGAVRMTSVVGFPHLIYKMVSHISTILV